MKASVRERWERELGASEGLRLPVRLRRVTPWSAIRAQAYIVALPFGGVAAVLGIGLARHWAETSATDRVGLGLFVVVFGLVALLALYAGVHQLLASVVAETIVEVDRLAIEPGETVRVCFLQPGPVALRSLRATLVRKDIHKASRDARRRGGSTRETEDYQFFQRFLDVRDVVAPRGGTFEQSAELTIPPGAVASGEIDRKRYCWLIEVWGRVRFWPGFMHQFEILVVPKGSRGRA